MTVVNLYFTLYYFYIFVRFMTYSTSCCLVMVSGIHGMYIVLYCIVSILCMQLSDTTVTVPLSQMRQLLCQYAAFLSNIWQ